MLFDQFAPMTQAAIAGMGIALLPDYLAGPELADGRLVPVLGHSIAGTGAYWLVWPETRASYPPLAAFRSGSRRKSRNVSEKGLSSGIRSRRIAVSSGQTCIIQNA
jgi:DNA-binding transcriptional LysR family regulator